VSRGLRVAMIAAALIAVFSGRARAAYDEVDLSTQPIGSSFYRHLAFDFGLDIRDLVKLERRGFGHNEVVTIVLLSKATGTSVKDYAKRRLKDEVLLKDLAAEAGLDYPTLLKNARAIKEGIESKGDMNLPPPVFEASPSPEAGRKKGKGTPSLSPSPSMSTGPQPAGAPTPLATPKSQ
jgi:hypothetical protein